MALETNEPYCKIICVVKQVDICIQLISVGGVSQEDIAILSPYNAQVAQIRDKLKERLQRDEREKITVTTITKSQGEIKIFIISTFGHSVAVWCAICSIDKMTHFSYDVHVCFFTCNNWAPDDIIAGSEWRYVILSMVRSCPSAEIEPRPSGEWLSKYIGFVGDENQINVGITRAQEGLCILGKI